MITEHQNYSLLSHNTFAINVKADNFIEYTSVEELKSILTRDGFLHKSFLHIGGGSNLLFLADYHGTILHSKITEMSVSAESDESVFIRVGAGVVWDDFVEYCVSRNLSGAENLSYIPGEVGASAVQNIGAYGVEVQDIIDKVETVEIASTLDCTFSAADCRFAYRDSIFKKELKGKHIITFVTYKLNKQPLYKLDYGDIKAELATYDQVNLSTIRQTVISIRQRKLPDPAVQGNAGSFFMNPIVSRRQFEELQHQYEKIPHYDVDDSRVKIPAAWMIDQCGWKGQGIGHAGVHDKQALVLVNKGGATGQEIAKLSEAIRASVKEKFGIDIHPEVNFIE